MQDVQLAIRWLRQYASALRIDPTRIGAVGDSAGGHLALFLGSLPTSAPNMAGGVDRAAFFSALSPKVSAVVDMFGPTDLTRPEMYTQLAPSALFGARPYPLVPNLYRNASPIFTLSTQTAPSCVVHGTLDPVVPVSQSLSLISRLSQLGVPYKFIPFLGGHSFAGLSWLQRTAIDRAALLCISNILRPNPLNAL